MNRAQYKAWTSACRQLLRDCPDIRAAHRAGGLVFRLEDSEGWLGIEAQLWNRRSLKWVLRRNAPNAIDYWSLFFHDACNWNAGYVYRRRSLEAAREERLRHGG